MEDTDCVLLDDTDITITRFYLSGLPLESAPQIRALLMQRAREYCFGQEDVDDWFSEWAHLCVWRAGLCREAGVTDRDLRRAMTNRRERVRISKLCYPE